MTWVATAGATTYSILNPQITKRLEGANTASFQCLANIPIGTIITIKANDTNVYRGKVRSIRRRTDDLNTIELMEEASDLKMFRLESAGKGIVTIDNPNGTRYLSSYISSILNGTGWTGSTTEDTNRIPGTSDPLPSVRFYNSTVAKALEKMITLVCGYKMWFDNAQKIVKYGNMNVDRSGTAIPAINVRPISSDINYGVDRVIVIGKTEDISGTATVGSPGSPPKTLMYQYTDCGDSAEAQSIAQQILSDRSILMERFECDILPGNYIYEEGDLVRISDAKTGTYGTYGIKDISISTEKTTLGLGCSEITIFDLLGDKLTEISGSSFNGVDEIWTGGKQNIGTTAPATYSIYIADKTAIDSFILSLKFDRWSKDIALASATSKFSVGQGGVKDAGSDNKLSTLVSTGETAAGGTNNYNSGMAILTRKYFVSDSSDSRIVANNRALTTTPVLFSASQATNYIKITPPEEGFHFMILEFSLSLKYRGDKDRIVYLYIYYQYGGTLPIPKSEDYLIGTIPIYICRSTDASNVMDPFWQTTNINISYPILGSSAAFDDTRQYEVTVSTDESTAGLVTLVKGHINVVLVENHDHSFTPIKHTNPISGASHAHSTSTLHDNHDQTDSGHAHTETDNKTLLGTGPSNITISITNATYPSGHTIASGVSGGISTWSQNILSLLANGDNIITISSATIGSVDASASFINYGK